MTARMTLLPALQLDARTTDTHAPSRSCPESVRAAISEEAGR
jgi:hypothetical protein